MKFHTIKEEKIKKRMREIEFQCRISIVKDIISQMQPPLNFNHVVAKMLQNPSFYEGLGNQAQTNAGFFLKTLIQQGIVDVTLFDFPK